MKKGLAVLESKERARFGIWKREEKKRSEEQKREKKRGLEFVETVDLFFPWVFYPLVISEVVYCSHDSDFSSEMKYIFP